MNLISFDPLRSLGVPQLTHLKPEHMYLHLERIRTADWLLFPASWQVNALHYGLGRRLFPSPATYHLGHSKIEITRALQTVCPAQVPETWIGAATPAQLEEALETLSLPLVAKEPRSARGEGVFLITGRAELLEYARQHEVLYLQEYLPIERDLRLVQIGDRVVSAYWRRAAPGAFHTNVARGGTVHFDGVPAAAIELVERVARQLGIDHAGFDVAEVQGRFYILEFNPLFGLEALNRQGMRLGPLIHDWLLRAGGPADRDPDTPLAA